MNILSFPEKDLEVNRKILSALPEAGRPLLERAVLHVIFDMRPPGDVTRLLASFTQLYTRTSARGKKARSGNFLSPVEIRSFRKLMRMTQFEFGELYGVTRFSIGNWERGNSEPCPVNRKKIVDDLCKCVVSLEAAAKKLKKAKWLA